MQEKFEQAAVEHKNIQETDISSLPVEKDPIKETESLAENIEKSAATFEEKTEQEITSGLKSLKTNDPIDDAKGKSLAAVYKEKAGMLKSNFLGKMKLGRITSMPASHGSLLFQPRKFH